MPSVPPLQDSPKPTSSSHLQEERESWGSQGGAQVWSLPGEWGGPVFLLRRLCGAGHHGGAGGDWGIQNQSLMSG